ncbi:alpha/beta fold hydrolase [Streptacidiphilus sp. MAP5-3]|uniref:alpha/beta fold hydrolase n=1 Tax=unclassified Streptacidiphilus TaxID=2643834 RepID=UPI003511BB42
MLPITDTPQQPHAKRPGRTLVASHSFSFARREWIEASAPLSEQFRVVAVDAPGHGEAREIPGYTMGEMAAAFAATINELGLTDYVLVGHSMTGKVMQILASRAGAELGLRHPPAKLVLVTPTPLGQEVGGEDLPRELFESRRDRADAEKFVLDRTAVPLTPQVFDRTCEDYARMNRKAWDAWLNKGIYEDWTERAAPIDVETLLIVADHDPVWGTEMQKKLTVPYLSNVTMVSIDSGHQVPLEAPQALSDLITAFAGS